MDGYRRTFESSRPLRGSAIALEPIHRIPVKVLETISPGAGGEQIRPLAALAALAATEICRKDIMNTILYHLF